MPFETGKKALIAGIVILIAVVPSVWLALLEFRTNDHLVEEVDRGLRTDAELFVERLAQYTESRVYEENARGAVESSGYLVEDPQAPGGYRFDIAYEYTIPGLVEYPFFIDFTDSLVYVGHDVESSAEVYDVFPLDLTYARVPDYFGYILRGHTDGPRGAFHYVYTFDIVGASSDIIMRGVKINPHVVRDYVLTEAYQELRDSIVRQRGSFPDELFGIEVDTPEGTIVLGHLKPALGRGVEDAIGVFEASFDPGGLFANWTARVYYFNQMKAQRLTRFIAIVVPLLIVVGGVVVAIRMTLREIELGRTKSAFVSNVSHELKTPLSKIRFFNELLRMGRGVDDEKRTRYFNVIDQECERLTLLVENVLDFSRIERGQMEYNFEEANLCEIVLDVCNTFSMLYESRGYSLETDLEHGLPTATVDPNAIKQALINLLDNAAKYSEPHTIRVSLKRAERARNSYLALSVIDRGIGIPSSKHKHIFKEFYRLDNSLSQRMAGSGLGLSLVKHIVKAHGGLVEVESKETAGSTFRLLLPVPAGTKEVARVDRLETATA